MTSLDQSNSDVGQSRNCSFSLTKHIMNIKLNSNKAHLVIYQTFLKMTNIGPSIVQNVPFKLNSVLEPFYSLYMYLMKIAMNDKW